MVRPIFYNFVQTAKHGGASMYLEYFSALLEHAVESESFIQ
ncbi:hypothetical protein ABES02_28235 [Neobacillus pocheonensis]